MASRLGFNLSKPNIFTARIRKPFFSASSLPSPAPVIHTLQFASKKLTFQRRLLCISPQATSEQPGQVQEDEVVDSNVLPYCTLDKKEKKTIGEMEQEFLQALQAFYYEGKSIMSNEEFDNLKEELMWEGSSVVMLSADEQRFLEASMAYVSGNPILSDEEYDKLKKQLKIFSVFDDEPVLLMGVKSWSRGLDAVYVAKSSDAQVYSDLSVDYLKMFLLNVPAAVVALVLFFFLDDLTGFEITYLLEGPCPNCGTENTSFFGTILSISSGGATNKVKCSNCGTDMVYDSKSRLITLPEGSEA
ncbi:hypothetical protein SASPL_109917 [Salvia splendens]|uniref:PGR5-like protein 1A, chloroplastic n=1 Tax=Salvia splendens TaxID=180675 RepID=A0A8X9A7K3_SALSN|nr:hypothetical protein SASPL_109917 [Salvia splendens]